MKMPNEDDLILETDENSEVRSKLDIIDMQLIVINTIADLDDNIYDSMAEDKIKVIGNAMKIIRKIQLQLIKDN